MDHKWNFIIKCIHGTERNEKVCICERRRTFECECVDKDTNVNADKDADTDTENEWEWNWDWGAGGHTLERARNESTDTLWPGRHATANCNRCVWGNHLAACRTATNFVVICVLVLNNCVYILFVVVRPKHTRWYAYEMGREGCGWAEKQWAGQPLHMACQFSDGLCVRLLVKIYSHTLHALQIENKPEKHKKQKTAATVIEVQIPFP